jgi:hypothetical protein
MKTTKKLYQDSLEKYDLLNSNNIDQASNLPDIIEIPDEPDVLQECIQSIISRFNLETYCNTIIGVIDWLVCHSPLNENEAEKHVLELLLKEVIAYYNEGWKPDFNRDNQQKYYFHYHGYTGTICINNTYYLINIPAYLYMKSEEVTEKVKACMGDYLDQYFDCMRGK